MSRHVCLNFYKVYYCCKMFRQFTSLWKFSKRQCTSSPWPVVTREEIDNLYTYITRVRNATIISYTILGGCIWLLDDERKKQRSQIARLHSKLSQNTKE